MAVVVALEHEKGSEQRVTNEIFLPSSAKLPIERRLVNGQQQHFVQLSKLLPIATKARLEEKARFEALERQMLALEVSRREDKQKLSWLEREVEDLRGRTGRTP